MFFSEWMIIYLFTGLPWKPINMVFQEWLKICVLLYFLQHIKVRFSATDGIMWNSVLKISFIHRVQATGPWILEMDKFHVFLAKYLGSTDSLDKWFLGCRNSCFSYNGWSFINLGGYHGNLLIWNFVNSLKFMLLKGFGCRCT